MPDLRYVLTVPVARGHNVTIISNRDMTPDAWAKLDRYLELQREIWADDASAGEAGTATDSEAGVAEGVSP